MSLHTQQSGSIEVITGCMFAGKTEELLRRLRRAEIADQSITVFSPQIDDRYGTKNIVSHDGRDWNATVLETNETGVETVKNATEYDIVALDEFNFFTPDFIPALEYLAQNETRVIVTGLDQTFRGEPFEPVHTAMAIADDVSKLSAVCESCGGKATRTQRFIEGEPAPKSADTISVGADESYEARCRHCHTFPN